MAGFKATALAPRGEPACSLQPGRLRTGEHAEQSLRRLACVLIPTPPAGAARAGGVTPTWAVSSSGLASAPPAGRGERVALPVSLGCLTSLTALPGPPSPLFLRPCVRLNLPDSHPKPRLRGLRLSTAGSSAWQGGRSTGEPGLDFFPGQQSTEAAVQRGRRP